MSEDFSYWDYRVVKHTEDSEVWCDIHRVGYNDLDEIVHIDDGCSPPIGDSREELLQDISFMLMAFLKPVIDYDIEPKEDCQAN